MSGCSVTFLNYLFLGFCIFYIYICESPQALCYYLAASSIIPVRIIVNNTKLARSWHPTFRLCINYHVGMYVVFTPRKVMLAASRSLEGSSLRLCPQVSVRHPKEGTQIKPWVLLSGCHNSLKETYKAIVSPSILNVS